MSYQMACFETVRKSLPERDELELTADSCNSVLAKRKTSIFLSEDVKSVLKMPSTYKKRDQLSCFSNG